MYIGAYSSAGAVARPQQPDMSAGAGANDPPAEDEAYLGQNRPSFFRTISSISHGSLASAYQAMRLHDSPPGGRTADTTSDAIGDNATDDSSVGAIQSGVGLPGALWAYGEAMDSSPD